MNGGDLDSALGLLNGPGVDANGSLEKTRNHPGKNGGGGW